jgi:hypothetical protein
VISANVVARNRANAQKSTGPKTQKGKARVARNATRHGAMSRPAPKRLETWLAIILDRPNVTPDDLMPGDEYGLRALALAEAELRLATAQAALDALFREEPKRPRTWQELFAEGATVIDLMKEVENFAGRGPVALRPNLTLEKRADGFGTGKVPLFENRRRLLTRYVTEARSRRRRAFEAWIAIRQIRHAQMYSRDIPKQSQSVWA